MGLEFKGLNCPFHTMSHCVSMCGPPPPFSLSKFPAPFLYSTFYLLSIFISILLLFLPYIHIRPTSPSPLYPYLSYSLFSLTYISYSSYSSFSSYPYKHVIFPLYLLSIFYPKLLILPSIEIYIHPTLPFTSYPYLSYSFFYLISISINFLLPLCPSTFSSYPYPYITSPFYLLSIFILYFPLLPSIHIHKYPTSPSPLYPYLSYSFFSLISISISFLLLLLPHIHT